MSMRAIFTCNWLACQKEFKTVYTGGKTHSMTHDWYEQPVVHLKVTDTRGDNYDFCSNECLVFWANAND